MSLVFATLWPKFAIQCISKLLLDEKMTGLAETWFSQRPSRYGDHLAVYVYASGLKNPMIALFPAVIPLYVSSELFSDLSGIYGRSYAVCIPDSVA